MVFARMILIIYGLCSISSDISPEVLSDRSVGRSECSGVHQWKKEQTTSLLFVVAQKQDREGR